MEKKGPLQLVLCYSVGARRVLSFLEPISLEILPGN